MKQIVKVRLLKIFFDQLLIVAAYIIAFNLTQGYIHFFNKYNFGLIDAVICLLILSVWNFFAFTNNLYDHFRNINFSAEFFALSRVYLLSLLALLLIFFFLKKPFYSRFFFSVFFLLILFLLLLQRALYRFWTKKKYLNFKHQKRILIIGASEKDENFVREIEKLQNFGYSVYGFLDERKKSFGSFSYLGDLSKAADILKEKAVDIIILALPVKNFEKINLILQKIRRYPVKIYLLVDYFSFFWGNFQFVSIGNTTLAQLNLLPLDLFRNRLLKRVIDLFVSVSLFLTVFWWLWPLIAVLIKIDSRGPVFFRQERWGEGGRPFICYKFRTMRADSSDLDENGKFNQARKDDPRLTRIGRILRRTNLDELPQFINVLKNEMSVIGPRPHASVQNIEYEQKIDLYNLRHSVKPGITGWAQVNGLRGETKETQAMARRVEYDLWYIENWSLWLDIQLCFKTLAVIFKRRKNL